MQCTVSQAIERCTLDLDRFLEIWPLLTSHDLLQALEACSGKTVSLCVATAADGAGRVEILLDCDSGRAAVDAGSGGRWGQWQSDGDSARILLEDKSGEWRLSKMALGATLAWHAAV
jgi:hypothetical protein